MERIVYKIRRPDGLYSTGGYWEPGWTKSGKAWTSIGALKNHLNLFFTYDMKLGATVPYSYPYEGCSLEEHVVKVSEKDSDKTLEELWSAIVKKKMQKWRNTVKDVIKNAPF